MFVCLFQNSSSWVLYNMASFYWRMKNEPQRAVDCVVRALHFSPRYCQTGQQVSALIYDLLFETAHRFVSVLVILAGCIRMSHWSTWPTSYTAPISQQMLLFSHMLLLTSPQIFSLVTTLWATFML